MARTATEVEATYSRWAFAYDTFTWLTERTSLDLALTLSALSDGESLLEVAVGTGAAFHNALVRNPSGRNVGIDLTEAMLRHARAKAEKTRLPFELLVGDARALQFESETFNVVMNNNMLGLVPESDFDRILSEMFRVLRPGGRLLIVTMMRPPRTLARWFYEVVPIWFGGWRDIEIEPFVDAAGFEIVECRVVTQFGIPSQVLFARKPA
jgi:ubiquinone/menaquinone biosynthesis C-methylase UbiE